MNAPGSELATRARELATQQLTDGEVAATLVVEHGYSLLQAREYVASMADDLLTCRHYGRGLIRQRLSRLAAGEDLGKVLGAHLAALDTYGKAYLNLSEHDKVAKLVEKAERRVAAGSKPKLVGAA